MILLSIYFWCAFWFVIGLIVMALFIGFFRSAACGVDDPRLMHFTRKYNKKFNGKQRGFEEEKIYN